MKPYIIIHNSVTLDGSLSGFMPDMELHYRLAGMFSANATLIGSETVITGQEMFAGGIIPEETENDFFPPVRDPSLPWWVIVDSRARLRGMLHTCRRFEYCRDIIILISKSTDIEYIRHLEERRIQYIAAGSGNVDMKQALELLNTRFSIQRILTDTGQVLSNLLINMNLADEISLLVHPLIMGQGNYPVFGKVQSTVGLSLLKTEIFDNGEVWITYKVGSSG